MCLPGQNCPQLRTSEGFPVGSVVKNPPANAGDVGSIPGSGRSSGEGNGNTISVFLPGESHGQRSYSPWGCKDSDTMEQLDNKKQQRISGVQAAG